MAGFVGVAGFAGHEATTTPSFFTGPESFVEVPADVAGVRGVVSLQTVQRLFSSLSATCSRRPGNGETCGGSYALTHHVEGWTGGELSFQLACDRCGTSHQYLW